MVSQSWALDTPRDEIGMVGKWLSERMNEEVMPHEVGVFVRSPVELDRARAAVEDAGTGKKVGRSAGEEPGQFWEHAYGQG